MTGDPIGTEVNDWLHREKNALALGYTIWKQIFKAAGGAGNLMEDRGSPTQNHMDHVHALFNDNGVPGIGEGGAGGGIVGRMVQFLRNRVGDAFDAIMNPIGAAIPSFGDSDVGRLPKTIFDTMRSSVRDFLTGQSRRTRPPNRWRQLRARRTWWWRRAVARPRHASAHAHRVHPTRAVHREHAATDPIRIVR